MTALDGLKPLCPHPFECRGSFTECGSADWWYETCEACGASRPSHDDDDRCRICWDMQDGTGPGHEWTPA